ncbi:oligosaccharyl transferase beta subunit [Crepidotus variabilis]|uniref:Dolichyl-diphosphooligosaccharide--protein glycosyltransferase subunit WBP1 n=1 Tax=Crepidotus variabilis TaxID=179855 RepID=A0A9P6JV68_9AGAR|nr:oligosaccharyl transferase beta subunit [Crepidotus variabilis]
MFPLKKLIILAVGLFGLTSAKSSTGNSVLVVVEAAQKDDFSIFFDGMRDQGYELTFRGPKEEAPLLIEYDEPKFAHVIVLASDTKNFAKDITPQSLISLTHLKTNLILGLSTKQTPLTSLASEFGLIPPPPGTPLISYFPKREEPSTLIPITPKVQDSAVLQSRNNHPIWFSGSPHALGNNPLLVPILRAPVESFASEVDGGSPDAIVDSADKGGEGFWAGSQLGVVTGFQTLDGARVTWVGGVDVFSDEYIQKQSSKRRGVQSGNRQFAHDVVAWTFQESLVLRIDKVEHHRVNTTEPRDQYTIKDQLEFNAYISKFNPKNRKWEPFSALKDLQLEFTMLDPHIRTSLPAVSGTPGKYSANFRAPDRHGVFKFVVDYKRKGWTALHSSTTVAVVPPRHDGYPRFLSAAWPYYAGAISTSVGFFLFSAFWLAGEVRESWKRPGKASKIE